MNYHPKDSQLLAWLAGLPAETEYVTRCALMRVLAGFRQSGAFRRRTEQLRSQIDPSAHKSAILLQRTNHKAAWLRAQLGIGA